MTGVSSSRSSQSAATANGEGLLHPAVLSAGAWQLRLSSPVLGFRQSLSCHQQFAGLGSQATRAQADAAREGSIW